MTSIKKRILFLIYMAVLPVVSIFATRYAIDGYGLLSLDFPEGFETVDSTKDGSSILLANNLLKTKCIIRIYDGKEYSDSVKALRETFIKLDSKQKETDETRWRNRSCAIGTFEAMLDGTYSSGYGVAVPLTKPKKMLVCLSYCAQKDSDELNSFLVSLLDSICIDEKSYTEEGIMTSYVFPSSKNGIDVKLSMDGKEINTSIKDNDEEASEYVIEREYEVLTAYATSKLWKEAWKRYYRAVYRDAYGRLSRASFDIYNVLSPDAADDTDLAQKVLYWVQEAPYGRNQNNSDFTSPVSILLGKGSDCDARSMTVCILLNSWKMDSIMMVSEVYSHALAGVTSTHKGHSFRFNGKDYLMGETTVRGLTWGKIAQNQDLSDNWVFIDF